MRLDIDNYTAFYSDSNNAFSWLVLIFKDHKCIGYKESNRKPNEESIRELIERFRRYDK